MANPRPRTRSGGFWRALRRLFLVLLLLFAIVGPPMAVLVYKFVPPPITILMIEREIQGHGLDHHWVPLGRISPTMVRAVIASEDARFCGHHGFDFAAIDKAIVHNEERPGKVRGGSTISQQTAKNVFLWPGRSYVRKGAGSLVHGPHRSGVGQATDHGGLPEHGGNGPWPIWRRGGLPPVFP